MIFRSRISIGLILLFSLTASRLYADPIVISHTAQTFTAADEGSATVGSPFSLAIGWSLQSAFSDVDISARLIGSATGTAYLMTQIGPTTTVADQLMSAKFTIDSTTIDWVPLFTDLDLQPGSYFLVLGSDSCCYGWGDTDTRDNPSLITAAGVTYDGGFGTSSAGQYPPASFSPATASLEDGFVSLEFGVTGNAAPAHVPEPGTVALLGIGIAAVVGLRRRSASEHRTS
jgi:hypothetical protein